jgi:2-polyprenyl-3-methyl-5-hydroxy-6-metoxy-1,4-benzoquinol methylase
MGWNHNTQYHGVVLNAVPANCQRALDIGCGRGLLTRKLALRCHEVVGIDSDAGCLAFASTDVPRNTTFINGDILSHPFEKNSFDFLVAVATLHHLPLRPALERFSELLRPSGGLVIVGLYRNATAADHVISVAALPTSIVLRSILGEEQVGAPTLDPTETLSSIRREATSALPGAVVRRQFFFRYTIVWRKPGEYRGKPDGAC